MPKILCTFIPQAWINDYAAEVDPEGKTQWTATVAKLPKEYSHESDELRNAPEAPDWCRNWHGPFEVAYEAIDEGGDE